MSRVPGERFLSRKVCRTSWSRRRAEITSTERFAPQASRRRRSSPRAAEVALPVDSVPTPAWNGCPRSVTVHEQIGNEAIARLLADISFFDVCVRCVVPHPQAAMSDVAAESGRVGSGVDERTCPERLPSSSASVIPRSSAASDTVAALRPPTTHLPPRWAEGQCGRRWRYGKGRSAAALRARRRLSSARMFLDPRLLIAGSRGIGLASAPPDSGRGGGLKPYVGQTLGERRIRLLVPDHHGISTPS